MDPRPEVHTQQGWRFPAYPGTVLIKLWESGVIDGCTYRPASKHVGKADVLTESILVLDSPPPPKDIFTLLILNNYHSAILLNVVKY